MEKDGSRIALLFGFVLALALFAVAGLAAMSALGLLQRRPAEPLLRLATPQRATPLPSPRRTQTPTALTPTTLPTPTTIVVIVQPTQSVEPPTETPTGALSPTDTATVTPSPTATDTPTLSPTPTNTITPTPSPYAGPYRAGSGADLHARHASAALRLDGELNEWNEVIGQDLSYIVSGAEAYSGMADIAGTVYAQWDTSYLYVAARVFDDVYVQTRQDDRIDLGDALIVWLDADLAGDFSLEVANEDDYQIGLSPGDFSSTTPHGVVWKPQQRADWDQAIIVSARRRSDGYTLEAMIPWSLLAQQPAPGRAFGFAVQLVDNDQPGTLGQDTVLSGAPNLRPGVPTSFGNLVLD